MSNRKAKRPSSARRNIKYDTFSTSVSCCRLRHVQRILQSPSSHAPEGILCIHGIDSRYNDGTRQLVDYLLFDFFEQRRSDFEKAGFDEETIDDVVLFMKRDCVHVYCNPLNYTYLLPYISHWPGLRVHCMKDKDYEDEEAAEDFKINSFISMTKDCAKIGIPYNSTAKKVDFDIMLVEKWPLVQAFALENYGGGGFFTMKHEVVDVSEAVHKLYSATDPVMVEIMTSRQLPLFERQWNAMLLSLEAKGRKEMKTITERMVCEALHSYFHHGRIGGHKSHDSFRQPFVLFGRNSKRDNIESAVNKGQITDQEIKDSLHMVVQAVSPRGPIACSRTYFFGQDYIPYSDSSVEADGRLTDRSLLSQLYMICMEAAHHAVGSYAASLSVRKACTEAIELIQKHCSKKRLPLERYLHNGENVKIGISATDNFGRQVHLEEGVLSLQVKHVEVVLYDVPSVQQPGSVVGSVMFSETFLNSSIPLTYSDGSRSTDAKVLILTENVPYHMSWMHDEVDQDKQLTQAYKQWFGGCFIEGEDAQITTCSQLVSSQKGHLYLYENGIVFVHSNGEHIVIPRTHFQILEFYDGDSPSVVAMLVITYKLSLQCHLPVYLHTPSRMVIVALSPRSKAYKTFYSEVYPLWKDQGSKPTLEMIHSLSTELACVHKLLQSKHETNPSAVFAPTKSVLPNLNGFLTHFAAGSLPGIIVPHSEIGLVLKRAQEALPPPDKDKLIISIVGGIPGSYVDALVKVITSTSKDDSKWVVIKPMNESTESFSVEKLHTSLAATIKAHKKLKPGFSRKQLRAVVVIEGFTSIMDIVRAIYSHPQSDSEQYMQIGAITYCIDPMNTFMDDHFTFPSLLDSCAQGWVNNIVFTSSLGPKNADLAEIQQLIRTVNSDVALMLANKGEVTRSPDVDLILSETAFSHPDMVRARHLLSPGWCASDVNRNSVKKVFNDVCLRFMLPLERTKLLAQLKALKGNLRKYPFTGNVYHVRGQVRFTDSASMMEFQYTTMSNSLMMNAAELQPVPPSSNGKISDSEKCNIVFTGCKCEESVLKDWIRKCKKQRPEKKVHRTLESITAYEVKQVQKKHHLDTLPEGWFYNGSQYVSFDGEKTNTHPDSERFVLAYLHSVNEQIDRHNASVDAQTFQDLFD